jgi:hypothetical protein
MSFPWSSLVKSANTSLNRRSIDLIADADADAIVVITVGDAIFN